MPAYCFGKSFNKSLHYIWVSEYGYTDEWKGKESQDLKKRGELIFDATLPPIDAPGYLAIHIPGEVIINRMREDRMVNELMVTRQQARKMITDRSKSGNAKHPNLSLCTESDILTS